MLRLFLAVALLSTASAQTTWTRVEGGDGSRCALRSPYHFFYPPGTDDSRLLIYFQGGGACWDWVNCSGMFDTNVALHGPDYSGDAPLTLERAYQEAAGPPNMEAIVQITSDRDAIQSAFYLISGSPAWREETYALLERVEAAHSSIHSFAVSGPDHGLMRTDAFYDYTAGGTRLVDWIARLISGEPVRCDECGA